MIADVRAIVAGIVVFVVLLIAYFALVTWVRDAPSFLWLLGYTVPLLAGCVTGFMASRREFVALLILGVAAAICQGILNFVWGWLGLPTDLGGLRTLPWVVVLSLVVIVPLVVIGGTIGYLLHRGSHA
jgi:hypothetical protein